MKNLKTLLLFISVAYLSSCVGPATTTFISMTNIKIPDGTPMFKKGFADGCSGGMYSRGNMLYRQKYGFRYDPKLIDNKEYYFANKRGYSYCFTMMANDYAGAGTSWDRFLLPKGQNGDMLAKDMGETWGGAFDGIGGFGKSGGLGGDVGGFFGTLSGGSGNGALSANPLWAGGSKGQFFGQ